MQGLERMEIEVMTRNSFRFEYGHHQPSASATNSHRSDPSSSSSIDPFHDATNFGPPYNWRPTY